VDPSRPGSSRTRAPERQEESLTKTTRRRRCRPCFKVRKSQDATLSLRCRKGADGPLLTKGTLHHPAVGTKGRLPRDSSSRRGFLRYYGSTQRSRDRKFLQGSKIWTARWTSSAGIVRFAKGKFGAHRKSTISPAVAGGRHSKEQVCGNQSRLQ